MPKVKPIQGKMRKKAEDQARRARKDRSVPNTLKKLKKDPGVPSLFPFKEKLVKQIEDTKRRAELGQARLAETRQRLEPTDQDALSKLVMNAAKRAATFESNLETGDGAGVAMEAASSGRRDNSKKAYQRELRKVVEAADVILEVLDARDPIGCRARQLEELIVNSGVNKRVILVLNKIDLVPRENVDQWLKHLRNEFPTIAFKSSTQNQRTNLGQSAVSLANATDDVLGSSECLGADTLVKLLKNYCRNANIKTSITVGVVGFPNVGKSSVINSLKRSKACNVGSTPGVTKVSQEIHLDKNIKLLDCPGIVFGKSTDPTEAASVVLRNCIKVELIEDPIAPVDLIVNKCNPEQLRLIYNIPPYDGTRDFLIQLSKHRGRLRRGGIPDIEGTARSVIQDWNSGRIPFYSLPPIDGLAAKADLASSIVTTWSKEFQMPDVVEIENKELGLVERSVPMEGLMALTGDVGAGHIGLDEGDEMMGGDEEIPPFDDDHSSAMAQDDAPPQHIPLDLSKHPRIRKANAASAPAPFIVKDKKQSAAEMLEKALNPQRNQERKKALKLQKRQERRAGAGVEVMEFAETVSFGLPSANMEED
ncbi:P-loop containing nucleoside triphosphate hydrolase protein [Zopfochytrium polystomum]|nr:P-loop containing nucleoside triphosphate hydrolase protein [Zopfochytrium polystomum]